MNRTLADEDFQIYVLAMLLDTTIDYFVHNVLEDGHIPACNAIVMALASRMSVAIAAIDDRKERSRIIQEFREDIQKAVDQTRIHIESDMGQMHDGSGSLQ